METSFFVRNARHGAGGGRSFSDMIKSKKMERKRAMEEVAGILQFEPHARASTASWMTDSMVEKPLDKVFHGGFPADEIFHR